MQWHSSYGSRQVVRSVSPVEKVLVGLAVLLLIIGVTGYVFDARAKTVVQPVSGGTYTEGVIVDSPTKVERIIARLTNVGLTYRASDGSIQPALAKSWTVSDDKKAYEFTLHEGISAAGLRATIIGSKTNWTDVTVEAPSESVLRFVLPEPLPLFLSTTTAALFPYGPYEIVKRDKREVVLRANTNFALGAPYIEKIVVKLYETQDELTQAAQGGEIDGSADFSVDTAPRSFTAQKVALPRYQVLFFNLTRPSLKKVEDRQRIIQNQTGNPATYTLLTSQTGEGAALADRFSQDRAANQLTLTVVKKSGATLQKEDVPKREYDLLLYGIDYGIDRDYYPFWHSSQAAAPGLNLSAVKDKELDGLLEAARKEPDLVNRSDLTKQIETMLTQKGYQHIMSQETFTFWVHKRILGVEYGTINDGVDRFNMVWKWYINATKVKPTS